jgi:hypothetical protein
MCRLMAYIGPPALVADVVLWPDRSIIKQVPNTLACALQPPAADLVQLALGVFHPHAVRHDDTVIPYMQSYDARERIMDASLPQHLAHGNLNGERPACRLADDKHIVHSLNLRQHADLVTVQAMALALGGSVRRARRHALTPPRALSRPSHQPGEG